MSLQSCVSEDLIEMTPPTARTLAQQENKRLTFVSMLLGAMLCLCVIAVSHLGHTITAKHAIGSVVYMPQLF